VYGSYRHRIIEHVYCQEAPVAVRSGGVEVKAQSSKSTRFGRGVFER
jgi:hypothetical protein